MTDLIELLLQLLTTDFVTTALTLFAIALGFFAIRFIEQRRQMLHRERMAALIKGLHFAGVAQDAFRPLKADSHDHLLSGLRWMCAALAVSTAMYGYEMLQPVPDANAALRAAMIGLIPGAMGLAQLLFAFICSTSSCSRCGTMPTADLFSRGGSRLTRRP